MSNDEIRMTKEIPMLNAASRIKIRRAFLRHWLFGLVHSLGIMVSSFVIFAIRVYQLTFSPAQVFLFGATGGCRFTPTCSAYAMDAVREHGAIKGTALTAGRICRCHPWSDGGHDPVPKSGKRKAETF
jgi:putative membrane protein insertion efficiency factor